MAFDLHQDPALHAQPLSWQCFSRHSSVFLMGALVCYGSCHQGPQTERLKIMEMYCTIALEARRPESGCWQGHAPSETKQTGFLAPSVFWWGLLLSLPWLTAAFISVFTGPPGVSPSLLSMRTSSYWIRRHPSDLISRRSRLQKSYFLIKLHLQVLGFEDFNTSFLRTLFNPYWYGALLLFKTVYSLSPSSSNKSHRSKAPCHFVRLQLSS